MRTKAGGPRCRDYSEDTQEAELEGAELVLFKLFLNVIRMCKESESSGFNNDNSEVKRVLRLVLPGNR